MAIAPTGSKFCECAIQLTGLSRLHKCFGLAAAAHTACLGLAHEQLRWASCAGLRGQVHQIEQGAALAV